MIAEDPYKSGFYDGISPQRTANSLDVATAPLNLMQSNGRNATSKPEPDALRKAFPASAATEHDHEHDDGHKDNGRIPRAIINFWLDAWLLVNFVLLGVSAVIVQFVFPPGIAARGWLLWGMSYGQWCSTQFAMVAMLAVGVLVHIMLHWTWVCSVVAKRLLRKAEVPDDGIRTVIGVGLLIGILVTSALCIGVAMLTIQEPPTL
ncbi:MAG: DUF4405 domain-containing protein [Planctomycetaceae bacterium]|nr:DUF4405 domain-containing protein [Planctomycetaceae bacterium]